MKMAARATAVRARDSKHQSNHRRCLETVVILIHKRMKIEKPLSPHTVPQHVGALSLCIQPPVI